MEIQTWIFCSCGNSWDNYLIYFDVMPKRWSESLKAVTDTIETLKNMYLFERLNVCVCERERQMADRNFTSCGSLPKWRMRQEHHPGLWSGWEGPSTWAILHCFPRLISRKLDQKWKGWDLNWCLVPKWDTSLGGGSLTCCATAAVSRRRPFICT